MKDLRALQKTMKWGKLKKKKKMVRKPSTIKSSNRELQQRAKEVIIEVSWYRLHQRRNLMALYESFTTAGLSLLSVTSV